MSDSPAVRDNTHLEQPKPGLTVTSDNTNSNTNTCPAQAPDLTQKNVSQYGFPIVAVTGLGLEGLRQEARYHGESFVDDLLHEVKHFFVKDETLDEQVRKAVEKKLLPEEKERLAEETKLPKESQLQHQDLETRIQAAELEITREAYMDLSKSDQALLQPLTTTSANETLHDSFDEMKLVKGAAHDFQEKLVLETSHFLGN
jgi:hypothetical protein